MSQEFTSAEVPETEPKKTNVWVIVAIIVGVLILIACCCLAAIFILPLLFGPSVGNIFSNILEGLVTPVP